MAREMTDMEREEQRGTTISCRVSRVARVQCARKSRQVTLQNGRGHGTYLGERGLGAGGRDGDDGADGRKL